MESYNELRSVLFHIIILMLWAFNICSPNIFQEHIYCRHLWLAYCVLDLWPSPCLTVKICIIWLTHVQFPLLSRDAHSTLYMYKVISFTIPHGSEIVWHLPFCAWLYLTYALLMWKMTASLLFVAEWYCCYGVYVRWLSPKDPWRGLRWWYEMPWNL